MHPVHEGVLPVLHCREEALGTWYRVRVSVRVRVKVRFRVRVRVRPW